MCDCVANTNAMCPVVAGRLTNHSTFVYVAYVGVVFFIPPPAVTVPGARAVVPPAVLVLVLVLGAITVDRVVCVFAIT
eukprot:12976091-Ditylum_brightwellii.AAC.1